MLEYLSSFSQMRTEVAILQTPENSLVRQRVARPHARRVSV